MVMNMMDDIKSHDEEKRNYSYLSLIRKDLFIHAVYSISDPSVKGFVEQLEWIKSFMNIEKIVFQRQIFKGLSSHFYSDDMLNIPRELYN